jgi:hypothetical protein
MAATAATAPAARATALEVQTASCQQTVRPAVAAAVAQVLRLIKLAPTAASVQNLMQHMARAAVVVVARALSRLRATVATARHMAAAVAAEQVRLQSAAPAALAARG